MSTVAASGLVPSAQTLIGQTLPLAVTLRIHELLDMPASVRACVAKRWADRAVDLLAASGDMLLRRTSAGKRHTTECVREGRRGCDCLVGTAEVFNHAARGLAALALGPSGVTWLGVHWCAVHPGGVQDCDGEPALDCLHVQGYDYAAPVETVRPIGGVL